MSDSRSAFLSAAGSYVAQVARIPDSELDGPGLGNWDLRSLVGHTSRSLVTVGTYLDQPAAELTLPRAADYYLAIAATLTEGADAVLERGRRAGLALGRDPAGFIRDLAARVADTLAGYDDDHVMPTIAGGMRLDEYLRTRTFELVVHCLDIAVATGVDPGLADEPLVDASTLAAEVAALSGRGPTLLLALTGRHRLPEGFTVV